MLDPRNFLVIMVGDFNTPGFDWKRRMFLPNSHCYSKLKEVAVYTSTCLLNSSQCTDIVGSSNLLDLNFFQPKRFIYSCRPGTTVQPDNYLPPLITHIYPPFTACIQNYLYSHRKFSSGDYKLLYNILSTYDCPCVYCTSSVASLNAALQDVTY
jgi:hypothetical protein